MSYQQQQREQDPKVYTRATIKKQSQDGSKDLLTLFLDREQMEGLYTILKNGLNVSPTTEAVLTVSTGDVQRKDGSGSFTSTTIYVKSQEPRDRSQQQPKPQTGYKPRAAAPSPKQPSKY